jgi:hypothetical protein
MSAFGRQVAQGERKERQSKETHAKSSMRVIHIELHYTASPHTCIQCHLLPLP